jgi:hypothetical protein
MDDVWAPDTISDSADAASGILVYASSGVTVSGNTVGNTQFGIAFCLGPDFRPCRWRHRNGQQRRCNSYLRWN